MALRGTRGFIGVIPRFWLQEHLHFKGTPFFAMTASGLRCCCGSSRRVVNVSRCNTTWEALTAEESSYCLFGEVFVSYSSAFFTLTMLSIFAAVQPHVVAVMLHRCVSHAACGNTCAGKLM
ncbi:hypothetical protein TvY486_0045680 [Trypanosoma vivax Y486]|uniref:Uncharacterized protein n=1 Tax=Trypanosoma vivax (strain Y486) TaxID=1055687 RepID=F9WVP1_TRYVY|nr:hypothetical protein TvY486_0045680 [Trypanosoma vivax Y486]|eukprot:CCD21649.1 hypothetical protein TvY486_0045680 [Trypanosoma vivax Y486]